MKRVVRIRLCTSLLAAAAALVAVQTARAQMVPTPQPEKVSNRALQLAAEGKLSEANKTLEEALTQCQRTGAPPNCAAMLSFTRAYLAQQRGRPGIDDARTFYRNVLATQPSNGAALKVAVRPASTTLAAPRPSCHSLRTIPMASGSTTCSGAA